MLGTCTRSPAASGVDESNKPTANIENDNTAPANGPAIEISTFVLRSGRIDLNKKLKIDEQHYLELLSHCLIKKIIFYIMSVRDSLSPVFHKYNKRQKHLVLSLH